MRGRGKEDVTIPVLRPLQEISVQLPTLSLTISPLEQSSASGASRVLTSPEERMYLPGRRSAPVFDLNMEGEATGYMFLVDPSWETDLTFTVVPWIHYADQASPPEENSFRRLAGELESLRNLSKNWNTYGAPPPSHTAIEAAREALNVLEEQQLFPTKICASAEGGIAFVFAAGPRYAEVEIFNDGDVVGAISDGEGAVDTWQVRGELVTDRDGLKEAVERIREFLA